MHNATIGAVIAAIVLITLGGIVAMAFGTADDAAVVSFAGPTIAALCALLYSAMNAKKIEENTELTLRGTEAARVLTESQKKLDAGLQAIARQVHEGQS